VSLTYDKGGDYLHVAVAVNVHDDVLMRTLSSLLFGLEPIP